MKTNKVNLHSANKEREFFLAEFESLLQASSNATGIPEPAYLNYSEEAGNYIIYLSKLTKQSSKHGY